MEPDPPVDPLVQKQALGGKLFFDKNLSKNKTQACSTCHDPKQAFIDTRKNSVGRAVSLGDDGVSLGDRNTPTIGYAKFSPIFKLNKKGDFVGGQFLDGREADLTGQAGGPPLNPIEMGMPDKASVIARIQENPEYVKSFKAIYGTDIFNQTDLAYKKMAESIAAFEKTEPFSPFDSRYDRSLTGEYILTDQEELGQTIFFSQQFSNCNGCHQLKKIGGSTGETFTNYKYHNLGVPINEEVRKVNGTEKGYLDHGLLDNPHVSDPRHDGKFRVPTLRNIAVTGPYMHNGVFKDLKTVILFYDKVNHPKRELNPESGEAWRPPEINVNLALETKEFKTRPLTDERIDALVAFLNLLTDKQYEDKQYEDE